MRDRPRDKESGKMTIAVYLGEKKSKLYFYILILLAIILISIGLFQNETVTWISAITFAPMIFLCIKVSNIQKLLDYNSLLKPLALTTFFYSLIIIIGWAI